MHLHLDRRPSCTSTDDEPTVAVVVATHERAHLLPRLLQALRRQTRRPDEVVIVDDASHDATPAVLAHLASDPWIRYERLTTRSGPATARNRGWRSATSELIAFTDDDCVPEVDWLERLVAAISPAVELAQGRTIPDPQQREGPWSRTMRVEAESGFYQTCNIAYRRTTLDRLGGFDERFRHPAGEDTDLAWRARRAGAVTRFVAEAIVRHDVRPSSFATHIRDLGRWEGVVLLVGTHPELRRLFHSRYWWKAAHPRAAAATLGILALAFGRRWTRLAGVVALAPYVQYRTAELPLHPGHRRRWAYLVPALVSDLVEVAVLGRASVRYRTVLL